jgi:hypothetical protein
MIDLFFDQSLGTEDEFLSSAFPLGWTGRNPGAFDDQQAAENKSATAMPHAMRVLFDICAPR